IRSVTGELATRVPGVTFGGSFPRLAALADRLAVVRSYVPGDANHDLKPLVGRDTLGANLGCVLPRVARADHPRPRSPTHAARCPRAAAAPPGEPTGASGRFAAPGPPSSADAPFDASRIAARSDDLSLAIPRDRLDDRRLLLGRLDDLARRLDRARA